MTTDARISTALADHPKTKKLHRRLGGDGCWALICLFLWTARNRSSGDLSGLTDEDIELAANWNGEEGKFIPALIEVGFLDGDECERRVHDWQEHNPWAAGADDRKESSKWAALCKRYGRAGAAERMPDYATRMRPACDPHETAPRSACDPDAPSPLPLPLPILKELDTANAVSSAAPQSAAPPPRQKDQPVVITIPMTAGREHIVTDADYARYRELYPGVDVMQSLRNIVGWLEAKPDKRSSSSKGARSRIATWLARDHEKTTTRTFGGTNATSTYGRKPSAVELVEREIEERHRREDAGGTVIEIDDWIQATAAIA